MVEENIETLLTKEQFDKYFKESMNIIEENLLNAIQIIKTYIPLYESYLTFRQEYRKDYKTHRLQHYLDKDGVLQYKKTCKRQIGYKYQNGKK